MYDADAYAPCRYHLIQRSKGQTALPASATNGTNTTTAAAAAAVASLPLPGSASRWQMQADVTGLDGHAHMVHRVNSMYQVYTLYYFLQVWGGRMSRVGNSAVARHSYCLCTLTMRCTENSHKPAPMHHPQGIILLMLILHLIHAIGFQPRLSVIPGR